MKKLLSRLRRKNRYPKWGSKIIDVYVYNELLVVVTQKDLFVSENGVYFERVENGN